MLNNETKNLVKFMDFFTDFKILAEHEYQVHGTPVKNHWYILVSGITILT